MILTSAMRQLIATAFYSLIFFTPCWSSSLLPLVQTSALTIDNQTFRNQVINYIHGIALSSLNQTLFSTINDIDTNWENVYQKTDWSLKIALYHLGRQVGEGYAHGAPLTKVLKKATEQAINSPLRKQLTKNQLADYHFKVAFDYYPARLYSFIDYRSQELELTGNRVAIRKLDTQLLQQQVQDSQRYLLQAMSPQWHGFFKFYDAAEDKQEELLRTIYTSSSLYTLLKLYHFNKDPNLEKNFKAMADFILARQVKEGPNAGSFYYGFDPKTNTNTCVLVVGTAAKTIFTLLELNRFYKNDPTFLPAARKAGDWLLTRTSQDGTVIPIVSCTKDGWQDDRRQSLLYSGQVLSALSRLYAETHDPRYYDGALKIATHFVDLIKQQGSLVGDDYRPANSISSSWAMMSLIDFAKVNDNPIYLTMIQQVATTLLSRQISDKADVYSNGRYLDAMTTSGNGWINEVMGVLYEFCDQKHLPNCQQYRQAMVLTSRWLLQNTYTKENTYAIKNPNRAIGGFITNFTSQTVRTDAVCHGLNSLITLLTIVGNADQTLLSLPEKSLLEILPLLRAGNGFL